MATKPPTRHSTWWYDVIWYTSENFVTAEKLNGTSYVNELFRTWPVLGALHMSMDGRCLLSYHSWWHQVQTAICPWDDDRSHVGFQLVMDGSSSLDGFCERETPSIDTIDGWWQFRGTSIYGNPPRGIMQFPSLEFHGQATSLALPPRKQS